MRAELDQISKSVARMEEALSTLSEEAEAPPRTRRRPERYYRVLLGVYEHGRNGMDSEAFGRLGAEHGYDRRGLGGFFVGARASLARRGETICLTDEGAFLLDEYLRSGA